VSTQVILKGKVSEIILKQKKMREKKLHHKKGSKINWWL
jgi:hypothetical protein